MALELRDTSNYIRGHLDMMRLLNKQGYSQLANNLATINKQYYVRELKKFGGCSIV